LKDAYLPPAKGRQGTLVLRRDLDRISKAAEFFASLPIAPRDEQGAIEIAMLILSGAVENLKAAGVDDFALGVALGRELAMISAEAEWPAEIREQILGKSVEQFRQHLRP